MGTELVGWRESLALTPYGDRFRELRRLLHGQSRRNMSGDSFSCREGTLAGKTNLAEYAPVEELETRRFLLRVLKNAGADLQEEIRRHVSRLPFSVK